MEKMQEDAIKLFGWKIGFIKKMTLRAIAEFVAVAGLLFAVGWTAHCEINLMLSESLEESLGKHIKTLAFSVESQFQQELGEISDGALMLRQRKLQASDLIDIARMQGQGTTIGIVREDGTMVAGDPLPHYELEYLYDVFRGQRLIYYDKIVGLLFAVPTEIDGRRCAYYETYDDAELKHEFGVYFYDGAGIVTLGHREGDWTDFAVDTANIELYHEQAENREYRRIFKRDIIDVIEKQNAERAIAHYKYEDKDYYTFGIKLMDGEFALFGCVPHDAISVGVEYVHTVMLGVFCLLIFVMIVFGRYLIKSVENKELQREKSLADRANKTKSEFLSNVSHELRTPLNAILGMDEMILRSTSEQTTVEYAENIRTAGNNLLGLVNDILDFSKIEAGKMEIINVDYQLSSVSTTW